MGVSTARLARLLEVIGVKDSLTAVVAISGLLIGGGLVVIGTWLKLKNVNAGSEPITAGMTIIGGALGLFQAHGRQQHVEPVRRKTEPGLKLPPG